MKVELVPPKPEDRDVIIRLTLTEAAHICNFINGSYTQERHRICCHTGYDDTVLDGLGNELDEIPDVHSKRKKLQ